VGSELIRLLEQEAGVEKERTLADAGTRAEEILSAARREAEEILASARQRQEGERAQARARATSTASLRASARTLAAKDEALRQVFDQAAARIRSAAREPSRRRTLIRDLLREAGRGRTGERVVVEVAPGDVQAAREALRGLGQDGEVRENAQIADGVRLTSTSGRVVIENTIPSRLARARREMVSRVAEILWGA